MAAPADKTDFVGKWAMNKSLSGSVDASLALQGIGFFIRKAVLLASVAIEIRQYKDGTPPVDHIDLTQTISGMSSSEEKRILDNEWHDHSDFLFGDVSGRNRWISLDEVDDEHLKSNWEEASRGGKFFFNEVKGKKNGWVACMTWGFQIIEGERRYCRNIVVKNDGKKETTRLVYDWQS